MCGIWQAEYRRSCSRRRVPEGDHAAALDRRHALPRGADLARDLDRRVERLGDVDVDERLEEDVVGPMLMHQRRRRLARRQHVVHGRQLVEVEPRPLRNVLGFGARRGDAHGDQLADVAHLLGRERRLLRHLEAAQPRYRADRLDARQVGCGEHRAALAGRDRRSPRMRACASGLRTKATSRMPASRMSATNCPRPRISRSSSLRRRRAPTPCPAGAVKSGRSSELSRDRPESADRGSTCAVAWLLPRRCLSTVAEQAGSVLIIDRVWWVASARRIAAAAGRCRRGADRSKPASTTSWLPPPNDWRVTARPSRRSPVSDAARRTSAGATDNRAAARGRRGSVGSDLSELSYTTGRLRQGIEHEISAVLRGCGSLADLQHEQRHGQCSGLSRRYMTRMA